MDLKISEIKRFVRSRLDELSVQEADSLLNEIDDRNLDLTIEQVIEEAITYIHLNASPSLMEGPTVTEESSGVTIDTTGRVLDIDMSNSDIEMLRLVSFRCGDSNVKLTSSFYEDSPQARMQLNEYVQGQPDSPVLVKMDDSPDYKPHYRYYTTDMIFNSETLAKRLKFILRYFPRPKRMVTSVSLSASSLRFTAAGGSKPLGVTADSDLSWKVYGKPDWISLSATQETGSKDITVTALNNDGAERTATIEFRSSEGSSYLAVSQAAAQSVRPVTPGEASLSASGGDLVNGNVTMSGANATSMYSFNVVATSGLAWSVSLDGQQASGASISNSYVSVSPAGGTGNATIVVMPMSANSSNQQRTSVLRISADGVDDVVISLVQMPDFYVDYSPTNLPAEGGNVTVAVTSSQSWTIANRAAYSNYEYVNCTYSIPGASAGSSTCIMSVPANTGSERREVCAAITHGNVTSYIWVSQAGTGSEQAEASSIQVMPGGLSFTTTGGSKDTGLYESVTVNATGNWSFDSSSIPDWFSVVRGGNGFTFSCDANSGAARSASISVYLNDKPEVKDVLQVSQAGVEQQVDSWSVYFHYGNETGSSSSMNLGADDTYDNIEAVIYHNGVKYTGTYHVCINDSPSWISKLNSTSKEWDMSTGYIWFSTERNTSKSNRIATVTVTVTGTTASGTFKVVQAGGALDPYFSISPGSDMSVGASVTGVNFTISSNRSWTVKLKSSTASDGAMHKGSGEGDSTSTYLSMSANSTSSNKTYTILATCSDAGISKTFTITQKAAAVDSYDIEFGYDEEEDVSSITLGADASASETVTVQLYKNAAVTSGNYSVSIEGGSGWIGKAGTSYTQSWTGSGDMSLKVAKNTGTARVAYITVTYQGYSETLVVKQSAQETVTNYFQMNPVGQTSITAAAASIDIAVSSNTSWSLSLSGATGATLSKSSGTGNAKATLAITANNTLFERTFTVTGAGAGTTMAYIVKQAAGVEEKVITVTPATLSFTAEGGTKNVTLVSNDSWSASRNDNLVSSYSPSYGNSTTGTTVAVTVEKNNTTSARSAKVTFSQGTNGKAAVLQISQAAGEAAVERYLTCGLSNETQTIPGEGKWVAGTVCVKVAPGENSKWTATSSASWLVPDKNGGDGKEDGEYLQLSANKNETNASRTATVTLKMADSTLGIDDVTITVTQPKATVLSVDKDNITVFAKESSGTIAVTSNVSWSATATEGLTINKTSGTGNDSISWSLGINDTSSDRTYYMYISTTDGKCRCVVTIVQEAGYIVAYPSSLSYERAGGDKNITIESTAGWSVTSKPSFVTVTTVSSSNSSDSTKSTVKISCTSMPISQDSRDGEVVFRNNAGQSLSVKVYQSNSASDTTWTVSPESVTILANATYAMLSVNCSKAWTAQAVSSAIRISPTSGEANQTVQVKVEMGIVHFDEESSSDITTVISLTPEGDGFSKLVNVTIKHR